MNEMERVKLAIKENRWADAIVDLRTTREREPYNIAIWGQLGFALSRNEQHREAIEQLRENIATTAEAGAKIIPGPMYAPVGYLPGRRRTAEEWSRAVDCWQQLGPGSRSIKSWPQLNR